jgi:hypothetical protein
MMSGGVSGREMGEGGGRTQTMRSLVSTSLLSRMALRTAEPSLPVALVRATLPILCMSVCEVKLIAGVLLSVDMSIKC